MLSDGKEFIAAKEYDANRLLGNEKDASALLLINQDIDHVQKFLGFSEESSPGLLVGYFRCSPDVLTPLFIKNRENESKLPESLIAKTMSDVTKAGVALQRQNMWHPGISTDTIFLEDNQLKLTSPFLDEKFLENFLEAKRQGGSQLKETVARQANLNVTQLGLSSLQLSSLIDANQFTANGQLNKEQVREGLRVANLNYSSSLVDAIEFMLRGRSSTGLLTFEELSNRGKPVISQNQANPNGAADIKAEDQPKAQPNPDQVMKQPATTEEVSAYKVDNPDMFRKKIQLGKMSSIAEVVWGKGQPFEQIQGFRPQTDPKAETTFRNDVSVGPKQAQSHIMSTPANFNPTQSLASPVDMNSFLRSPGTVANEGRANTILDVTQQARSKPQIFDNFAHTSKSEAPDQNYSYFGQRTFPEVSNLQVKERDVDVMQPTVVVDGFEQSRLGMYAVGYRNDFEDAIYNKVNGNKKAGDSKKPSPEPSFYRGKIGRATAEVLRGEKVGSHDKSGYLGIQNQTLNSTLNERSILDHDRSVLREDMPSKTLANAIMMGSLSGGDTTKKVDEINWSERRTTQPKIMFQHAPRKHNQVISIPKASRQRMIFEDSRDDFQDSFMVNLSQLDKSRATTTSLAEKIMKDIEGHQFQNQLLDISAIHEERESLNKVKPIIINLNEENRAAGQPVDQKMEIPPQKISSSNRSQSVGALIRQASIVNQPPMIQKPAVLQAAPHVVHQVNHPTHILSHFHRPPVLINSVQGFPPSVHPSIVHKVSVLQPPRIYTGLQAHHEPLASRSENRLSLRGSSMLQARLGPNIHVERRLSVTSVNTPEKFYEYKVLSDTKVKPGEAKDAKDIPKTEIVEPSMVYQWHNDTKEYWVFSVDNLGNRTLVDKRRDLPLKT